MRLKNYKRNIINRQKLRQWQGDFPRHFSESAWRPFCPINVYGLEHERIKRQRCAYEQVGPGR